MKIFAEIKPLKLRETLTENAEGNREPSLSNKEGAETRRGVCIQCQKEITGRKSKKFCSSVCRNRCNSYKHRVKKGLIKKPGVGSGGNQYDKNNHRYKDGSTAYRKKPFRHGKPKICERCNSKKYILVHHKDENRTNNVLSNLEILCKKCHQKHHCVRDKLGKYTKG